MEGEPTSQMLLDAPFDEGSPHVSPDGHWLAYDSDESGPARALQVFVQAFPGLGKKVQISTDGGHWPHWAPDGRELFYVKGDTMMVVSIETEPTFRAGRPEVLFNGKYLPEDAGGTE